MPADSLGQFLTLTSTRSQAVEAPTHGEGGMGRRRRALTPAMPPNESHTEAGRGTGAETNVQVAFVPETDSRAQSCSKSQVPSP